MKKAKIAGFCIVLVCICLPLVFLACGSSPAADKGGGKDASSQWPAWVKNADSLLGDKYVAAVGEGRSLEEAQYKARANLLGIFGMKLADESVIKEMVEQVTSNNTSSYNETVSMDRRISSSAAGILAGCELKEQWKSENGKEFYALAAMEKTKAVQTYTDIIRRLSQSITEALKVSNMNSIDAYIRYRVAANLAEDIDSCINVLRYVGGTGSVPAGLKSKNEYLVEASNIVKNIPVRVAVTRGAENDPDDRIRSAFAKAVGDFGFRTGDASSPYVLDVTVALSEVELPNPNNYKYARYEITANFIQTSSRQGVVPAYSINGREGHASLSEARQRAIRTAEQKIAREYKDILEANLTILR